VTGITQHKNFPERLYNQAMGKHSDCNNSRPMMKIWYVQVSIFGSFLLVSAMTNSGTAMAAGTLSAQPVPTTTPGIATPDEAVRQMALGAMKESPKIAATQINSSLVNTNKFSGKAFATKGAKPTMISPSQVMNNCRGGNCEFNSAQPPVTLGTAAPMGSNITPSNIPTPAVAPLVSASASPAATSESLALKALNDPAKIEQPTEQPAVTYSPPASVASQLQPTTSNKSSILGGVNQQLAYLKEMAITSSKQFFTTFPQIDASLFAMGNGFASAKAVSFNPRLTLGNIEAVTKPIASLDSPRHQLIALESLVLKQPTPDKMLLLSKNLPSSNTPKLLLLSSRN
jgi:hypothetical protein